MIKSLLHFNNPNNLTRDEVEGVPWTVNGTVSSSQDGKFRNCLSMTGNGYLQNNTIDLSLDKEWTLDMWIYASKYDINQGQSFFSISSGPTASPRQGIFSQSGKLYIAIKSDNSWSITPLGTPINQWVHFALVNSKNKLIAYVNGMHKLQIAADAISLSSNSEVLIGINRTLNSSFVGLIDEFRISNKALWTSDFTPPTHETSTSKYIFIDKNNTVMGMRE